MRGNCEPHVLPTWAYHISRQREASERKTMADANTDEVYVIILNLLDLLIF